MTNKEAINVLRIELVGIPCDIDKSEFEQAVNLAIKALRQIDLIKFNVHAMNELLEGAEND